MSLSPLDETGNPVDWWFLYKVPKLIARGDVQASIGFEYAYFDSQTDAVSRSPFTLDGDNGALFHTLDALFRNPTADTGWILYNDEEPGGVTSLTLGHTKGVIGFDAASDTAFWLLHSWPKFPTPDDTAQPSPMFGQTFLCIALDLNSVRKLATQMHGYQEPQVYASRIPDSFADDDALRLLTSGIRDDDPAGTSALPLISRGGEAFTVIAKNRNWNDDFWNNLVVDVIKADIDVDTWVNGPGAIPGVTDPSHQYSVEDIKYITLQDIGMPWAWPETKDHAKWAISKQGEGNWVCVGDINRKVTQRLRGGCTIAFKQDALWTMLSKTDRFVIPEDSGLTEKTIRAGMKGTTQKAIADAQALRKAPTSAIDSTS
jgi:deoxyribonuclease-2